MARLVDGETGEWRQLVVAHELDNHFQPASDADRDRRLDDFVVRVCALRSIEQLFVTDALTGVAARLLDEDGVEDARQVRIGRGGLHLLILALPAIGASDGSLPPM